MAKTIEKPEFVKKPDGAFTKFFRLTNVNDKWEETAISYLCTRAEYYAMVPGYAEVNGKVILGFKAPEGHFVT